MITAEEQSISSLMKAFHEAWNKGDARVTASCFTDDGIRVGPEGDIQHGKAEIEAAYDQMLKTMPGTTLKFQPGSIRMLSSEYATWQAEMEIIPAGGKSSAKGYSFALLKKVDGRWFILEAHPKSFPLPARAS
jgi:uncharacterized protein (TIGR02246 family)